MANTDIFKEVKDKILVNTHAIDVFVPYEYVGAEYRGTIFYAVVGTQVKYLAICNMRVYKNAKEFDNPLSVPTYVLGIPMVVVAKPTEIDVQDVQFTKNGPKRKCVVLTFMNGDEFISNHNAIKTHNHVMMLLNKLDGGKLTFIPPHIIVDLIGLAQKMNGVNLRIPPEIVEMYVSERYRDPDNTSRKLRFNDKIDEDSDRIVSYRMREEAMQTSTYQAITHEDINNALITSVNRKKHGIISEPTLAERITRGLDISDLETGDDT